MGCDLDEWIETLKTGEILPEDTVRQILERVEPVLSHETNVLRLSSPLVVCGDIHGQLDDLQYLLSESVSGGGGRYLFMGDYVDRGHHSINTFLLLVALKLRLGGLYLLRGNHESRSVTQQYGFYSECVVSYGHAWVYHRCNEIFDLLPIAAVIDRQIFAVHGGLSPEIPLVAAIGEQDRVCEIPEAGPLADLTWSDPENVTAWRRNQRGAGFLFGAQQAARWCRLNALAFVARSHPLAADGFQWWFRAPECADAALVRGRLLLVWSAPNYAYQSGNKAAVLKLGCAADSLFLEITTFGPSPKRIPRQHEIAGHYFM
jgi:diadenosine tetraphosphatase ApaH/serine/threonine PP2A family protein phosphatase